MKPKIILASNSPRRRELLSMLGMEFSVTVSECDEDSQGISSPDELVRILAERKAEAVSEKLYGNEDMIIIAADTIVWHDGKPLGKPSDEEDAVRTLLTLSDSAHSVYTGLCLIGHIGGSIKKVSSAVETGVVFGHISKKDAENYVKTGEPMDKAGAYAVQGIGGMFVKELHGDYFNVVGLPVSTLRDMLTREFGYNILTVKTEEL